MYVLGHVYIRLVIEGLIPTPDFKFKIPSLDWIQVVALEMT